LKPIPLYATIFCSKSFFCKLLQELPLVALQKQQKNSFFLKRIFAAIGAKTIPVFEKKPLKSEH
jgi:hypothetical protein